EVRAEGHLSATTGADIVRTIATGGGGTLDGSGIGIAILDSGIQDSHVSLGGSRGSRVVASKNFTDDKGPDDDDYGHGTYVASIAAGNAVIASGEYVGVAPNANLINVQVLNRNGTGKVSWLLSALDWVMTNRVRYNIRVINMSLGTSAVDSYRNDP